MSDHQFKTHRPSGAAAYPIVLLSGVEGGGKSWTAAAATGLPGFHEKYWLEFGEQMAEEYGGVPGADYQVIEMDGSYKQLLGAAQWAAKKSKEQEAPSMLVFDSVTKLWEMLSDEQQIEANRRAAQKGRKAEDAAITVDQWNKAKERFYAVLDALRSFNGLVIVTARLDNTAVIGPGGTPTGEKVWKIRAQKDLPFDCQVIMQARAPRQWTMTKVTSRYLLMPSEGYMEWPDFTIEELLIRMELDPTAVQDRIERSYVRPDPAAALEGNAAPSNTQGASQDRSDEPRGHLAPLPEDLNGTIKELEAKLDRATLFQLYNLAKAHENRIATAKIESAGKRVARRLEAGETPPSNQSAEQDTPQAEDVDQRTHEEKAQEAELQRLADEAESRNGDNPAQERVTADPKAQGSTDQSESSTASSADQQAEQPTETTESSQSSPDDSEQESSTADPKESGSSTEPVTDSQGSDEPPYSADPTDEHPHGRNVWSGVAVADPADRQETPRRKGTITALVTATGGMPQADDLVFGMKGLSIVECSTKELADVLKYQQGGVKAAS